MVWIFFLLVALVVVIGFAAVLTGRYTPDPMADPVTSTPHHGLPPGRLRAADVDAVRFDTALRGYRMDQVDEVVDRLQERLAELEATAEPVPTALRRDDDRDRDGAHRERQGD